MASPFHFVVVLIGPGLNPAPFEPPLLNFMRRSIRSWRKRQQNRACHSALVRRLREWLVQPNQLYANKGIDRSRPEAGFLDSVSCPQTRVIMKLESLLSALLASTLIGVNAYAADIELLNVSYDPTRAV